MSPRQVTKELQWLAILGGFSLFSFPSPLTKRPDDHSSQEASYNLGIQDHTGGWKYPIPVTTYRNGKRTSG